MKSGRGRVAVNYRIDGSTLVSLNAAGRAASADICRYLQIFMKVRTIQLSARCTKQLPCLRLRRRTQIAHSPRTDRVRRIRCVRDRIHARRRRRHVVVRHRRRPGPPPPAGRRRRFRGGAGGCRRCRRHSRSCSPRRQGDARLLRRQDGERRHALPDHHPPCPSPLATSS